MSYLPTPTEDVELEELGNSRSNRTTTPGKDVNDDLGSTTSSEDTTQLRIQEKHEDQPPLYLDEFDVPLGDQPVHFAYKCQKVILRSLSAIPVLLVTTFILLVWHQFTFIYGLGFQVFTIRDAYGVKHTQWKVNTKDTSLFFWLYWLLFQVVFGLTLASYIRTWLTSSSVKVCYCYY